MAQTFSQQLLELRLCAAVDGYACFRKPGVEKVDGDTGEAWDMEVVQGVEEYYGSMLAS